MNTIIVKMTLEASRVNAGYKQSEAAKKLDITQTTLSSWEKNSTRLSYLDAKKLVTYKEFRQTYYFLVTKNELIRSNRPKENADVESGEWR